MGGAVEKLQSIRLSISLACDVFRKLNPQFLMMQTIEFFRVFPVKQHADVTERCSWSDMGSRLWGHYFRTAAAELPNACLCNL